MSMIILDLFHLGGQDILSAGKIPSHNRKLHSLLHCTLVTTLDCTASNEKSSCDIFRIVDAVLVVFKVRVDVWNPGLFLVFVQ